MTTFTSSRSKGHTHNVSLPFLPDGSLRTGRYVTTMADGHTHDVVVGGGEASAVARRRTATLVTSWHVDHDHVFNVHQRALYAPNPDALRHTHVTGMSPCVTGRETALIVGATALLGLGLYLALRPSPAAAQAAVSSVVNAGQVLSTQLLIAPDGSACSSPKTLQDLRSFLKNNSLIVARPLQAGEAPVGDLGALGLAQVPDLDATKADSGSSTDVYLPSKGVYPKNRFTEAAASAKVNGGIVLSSGYHAEPCSPPGPAGSRAVTGVLWVRWAQDHVFNAPPGLEIA